MIVAQLRGAEFEDTGHGIFETCMESDKVARAALDDVAAAAGYPSDEEYLRALGPGWRTVRGRLATYEPPEDDHGTDGR
jgi:hypothetical protein